MITPGTRSKVTVRRTAHLHTWVVEWKTFLTNSTDAATILRSLADDIEAQMAPPKPDEPTGLGAVVEDVNRRRWVRGPFLDMLDGEPWLSPIGDWVAWDKVPAARVLSPGWSEDPHTGTKDGAQ